MSKAVPWKVINGNFPMTKRELINNLAVKAGISNVKSAKLLDSLTSIIGDTLARGEKVNIVGFGTFHLSKRLARSGVNPSTGKKIKIPEMAMPSFRAGVVLKRRVRR
jgi:DNA-binding protein HU-beta